MDASKFHVSKNNIDYILILLKHFLAIHFAWFIMFSNTSDHGMQN